MINSNIINAQFLIKINSIAILLIPKNINKL